MFLKIALTAYAALALVSLDANAAGCTGSTRQRLECLEKQLDATTVKLEATERKLAAVTSTADQAKTTADGALKKANGITLPDFNNVRIQWRVQPGNCLYVEPGSGIVRAGLTGKETCGDSAGQRFDLLK